MYIAALHTVKQTIGWARGVGWDFPKTFTALPGALGPNNIPPPPPMPYRTFYFAMFPTFFKKISIYKIQRLLGKRLELLVSENFQYSLIGIRIKLH